jgi:hypothetical protein
MRNLRRTWFSAPLVVVTAGCGSSSATKDPTDDFAYVHQQGSACTYNEPEHCPKGAMCNPPPPLPIECPAGIGKDEWGRVGPKPKGQPGECVLMKSSCNDLTCAIDVPCPAHDWGNRTLATLEWAIDPTDDGKCSATPGSRTTFDSPAPAVTIDCPASLTDHHGFIARPSPTAECQACAQPPCADADPKIACPSP